MSGDVRHFKRKFFGGFDTNDVMRYIEDLATQRNKYKTTGDRLEGELKILNEQIKTLQAELDDADRRIMEIKLESLDAASDSVSSLSTSYTNIRAEMEATTTTICDELTKLSSTLTLLTSILDNTGSRFSDLQSIISQEKADAIAAIDTRVMN